MLITTHALATVAMGKLVGIQGPELIAAIGAGVVVDLDHLFVDKQWITCAKAFIKRKKQSRGQVYMHSWLQEFLVGTVLGVAFGLLSAVLFPVRWWIIPLFLLLHIAMDGVMRFEHKPFAPLSDFSYCGWIPSSTRTEAMLSGLALILGYFIYF